MFYSSPVVLPGPPAKNLSLIHSAFELLLKVDDISLDCFVLESSTMHHIHFEDPPLFTRLAVNFGTSVLKRLSSMILWKRNLHASITGYMLVYSHGAAFLLIVSMLFSEGKFKFIYLSIDIVNRLSIVHFEN